MAKLVNDQVVVTPRATDKDNASFATLRTVAQQQSPVSQRDPSTVAKGK